MHTVNEKPSRLSHAEAEKLIAAARLAVDKLGHVIGIDAAESGRVMEARDALLIALVGIAE